MHGDDFLDLSYEFGTPVRWQRALPCPCTDVTGFSTTRCSVCGGHGFVYDVPSEPFFAAIIEQKASRRQFLAQTMGEGEVGDSMLFLTSDAPCYLEVGVMDHFWALEAVTMRRVVLMPDSRLLLPPETRDLRAWVKLFPQVATLTEVPPPAPGGDGLVRVDRPTTLTFLAPKGYVVQKDVAQPRTFGQGGLPKRLPLKAVDTLLLPTGLAVVGGDGPGTGTGNPHHVGATNPSSVIGTISGQAFGVIGSTLGILGQSSATVFGCHVSGSAEGLFGSAPPPMPATYQINATYQMVVSTTNQCVLAFNCYVVATDHVVDPLRPFYRTTITAGGTEIAQSEIYGDVQANTPFANYAGQQNQACLARPYTAHLWACDASGGQRVELASGPAAEIFV